MITRMNTLFKSKQLGDNDPNNLKDSDSDDSFTLGSTLKAKANSKERGEKLEALMRRKWIFDPYSRYRQLWDVLATLALITTCLITPAELAFYTHFENKPSYLGTINRIIDVIFIIDIIVSFNTSYFNKEKNNFTTDRKKIAKNYLKTWFFIDFIAVIDFEFIFKLFMKKDS